MGARRTWLIFVVLGLVAGIVVAVLVRSDRDPGFESVEALVEELRSSDVDCQLRGDPERTESTFYGGAEQVNYESGDCEMNGETVRLVVFDTEEQAAIHGQEVWISTRGSQYLSDSNWEVWTRTRATSESIRDVIGGHYSTK